MNLMSGLALAAAAVSPYEDKQIIRHEKTFDDKVRNSPFVALTRIISAVFRKGGDVTFLVEELHTVVPSVGDEQPAAGIHGDGV